MLKRVKELEAENARLKKMYAEAKDESTRWRYAYNHDRPHRPLRRQTPAKHLTDYRVSRGRPPQLA